MSSLLLALRPFDRDNACLLYTSRFVKAFGTVIVEGAIVDMITGEVCFSTQKVIYAPVINGKNIFTDAYITKRYTITYDKIIIIRQDI